MKVSVTDDAAKELATASREYQTSSPKPGWVEQDPADWWKALVACCGEIKETAPGVLEKVDGVSLCGQMHTQVLLDSGGEVVRPAITWMDQRSADVVAEITGRKGQGELIVSETQNQLTTTYTAAHLAWIQRQEPEAWQRVSKVLVAKDYLKYLLTGAEAIDYSEASGTLLFNNETETWSDRMLELFDVPREVLPDVAESNVVIGEITEAAAEKTHLRPGVKVVNGSTDNSAAALGAGMVTPGEAALIIGTAGVVSVCSDRPLPDPEFRTLSWHYCLPGRWINLGVTQTAGESLNWFKSAFDGGRPDASSGDIFAEYNREIAAIPDGSEGLVFLPYLNGERTPHWDTSARGVFFGLGLGHRKAHFIKAIMEGVSFALRNCVESVEDLGTHVREFRAVGGGLKSPIWRTSLARIMGRPINTVKRPDTGNIGNAMLAGMALGVFSDPEHAASAMVEQGERMHEETPAVYDAIYRIYTRLYSSVKGDFAALQQSLEDDE